MNYKNYIKNNKLILPKGFNSYLFCPYNDLSELILPEGFNSDLFCSFNNLNELILPEGFNNYLSCSSNKLNELILPEGFNSHLSCAYNNISELILPEGFNSYLSCDNIDIIKIAEFMKEFNLNYFKAGIKIINQLDLNKLPKLKTYYSLRETAPQYRDLKLNIILNEL